MRSHRIVSILLVVAGIYVLVQPFAASPASCLAGWTAFEPVQRLTACLTTPGIAPAFVIGGVVGIGLLLATVWDFTRRS